jgi:hypothetical protein
MGDFHSGSTFEIEIDLDEDSEMELKESLEKGYIPIFYARSLV